MLSNSEASKAMRLKEMKFNSDHNLVMKLLIISCMIWVSACNTNKSGMTVKELNRIYKKTCIVTEDPWDDYILVEGGTFTMGLSSNFTMGYDSDIKKDDFFNTLGVRRVTVSSFYLQKYEVTNYEYRKFVHWVRDSIAHTLLEHFQGSTNEQRIDWNKPIDWEDERLKSLFHLGEDRFARGRTFIAASLTYSYPTYGGDTITLQVYPDTSSWTRDFPYSYNEPMVRNYFWHPAFDYYPVVGVSFHQAQAYCHWKTKEVFKNTYASVRLPTEAEWEYAAVTNRGQEDEFIHDRKIYPWGGSFFIPPNRKTGGPFLFTYNCNAGSVWEGGGLTFAADNHLYTAPVQNYLPNDYGFYQMAGNVAEWIADEFDNSGFVEEKINWQTQIVREMDYKEVAEQGFWNLAHNTQYKEKLNDAANRSFGDLFDYNGIEEYEALNESLPAYFFDELDTYRLTKGGSWADSQFYLQVGIRNIANGTLGHSTVGFRTAMISVSVPGLEIETPKKEKTLKRIKKRKRYK